MKKLTLAVILIIFALSANAQTAMPDFILGRWELKTAKEKITESWVKSNGQLLGKSYRHNLKGDSILTETVVIKKMKNRLYFCVTGMEKDNLGTTNFELILAKNGTYIFENKSHDFPQRIGYQNKGNNQLLAWIEGNVNGSFKKYEFPYHRSK